MGRRELASVSFCSYGEKITRKETRTRPRVSELGGNGKAGKVNSPVCAGVWSGGWPDECRQGATASAVPQVFLSRKEAFMQAIWRTIIKGVGWIGLGMVVVVVFHLGGT